MDELKKSYVARTRGTKVSINVERHPTLLTEVKQIGLVIVVIKLIALEWKLVVVYHTHIF